MLERAQWLEEVYKLSPDSSSDNDSQYDHEARGDDAQSIHQSRVPASQMLDNMQRSNAFTQVIDVVDLGTPSASECSEGESERLGNISATPLSVASLSKPGIINDSWTLFSDPLVVDTVEASAPAVVAQSRASLGDTPEHASIASISRWTWRQLEETQDRKRAVSRAVFEMNSTDREVMRQRLQKVGRANMIREIPACIDMFARGDKRMPGVLPQDLHKIIVLTRLFLCWWTCSNRLQQRATNKELEELASCLRQRSPDPAVFCDYVDTILSTTFSLSALNQPTQPSQAEIIEISDDDDPPAAEFSKRKAKIYKPGSVHKSDPIVLG